MHLDHSFDILHENKIPLGDDSIDCILVLSVLHHISAECFKNNIGGFHRVIKQDGKILVIEPFYSDPQIVEKP